MIEKQATPAEEQTSFLFHKGYAEERTKRLESIP
jgi:hypothetical protein